MRRPWPILLLCLFILAPTASWGRSGPFHDTLVFILAGQSNMSGRGDLGELPPGFPAHGERLANFNNAYVWTTARAPLDDPQGQKDACSLDPFPGVGPGVAFGERLCELMPGIRVGLVPCARGGATLAAWAPAQGARTLYGSSLQRAAQAAKQGRVGGVLFYQGESDTASRAAAEAWPKHFADLVAAWRRDLGDPHLPVVFAQLCALGKDLAHDPLYRYWDLLKEKQAAIRLPRVLMVRSDDLPLKPDGLHLSTAGQMILGQRMAQAMHRLLTHRAP